VIAEYTVIRFQSESPIQQVYSLFHDGEVKVSRVPIPDEVAAKVLFYSDRICCVCRIPKKPLQIHHIDGDNSNNALENLAILCLDCHTETQIKGGFGRKLDATQVKLYCDEWLDKIGRYSDERKKGAVQDSSSAPFAVEADAGDSAQKHERVESRLKELKKIGRLTTLVRKYNDSGQLDLRDKYIDKLLLNKDVSAEDELFFRAMQGKIHLVDTKKLQNQLDVWKKEKDWSRIARAYRHLGRHNEAIEYYCLTCIEGLREGNPFSAGYYMKEMIKNKLVVYLFERALQQAKEKDDVWWQIRSLQELDRDDEIDELVLQNRELIERRRRGDELIYLHSALKRKKAASGATIDTPASDAPFPKEVRRVAHARG